MTPRRARRVARWFGAVSLASIALAAPAAARGSVDVGEVALSPAEGGSGTAFTLELPAGASCPGDSANDGYRVQTYMVPESVDPTTVTYDGTGPIPYVYGQYADFRQPLYDTESNSFVSAQTADAPAPGEPGAIINLPAFDYAVYSPGQLPPGRYHLGIACTLLNEVVAVWDTQVEVTEAADDEPAEIRWAALGASAGVSDSDPPFLAIGAIGLAAVAGITLLLRRSRRPAPTTPTPSLEDA